MTVVKDTVQYTGNLIHRLFFTADDELDIGWLILGLCCVFGLAAFGLEGAGLWSHISNAAWAWFGTFTTLSFISGVTINRARLIASSEAVKGVPGAIGTALIDPNRHKDPFLDGDDDVLDPRAPDHA